MNSSLRKIKIGTRGSKLAVAQTEQFADSVTDDFEFEIKTFVTSGDKKQNLHPDTARDKKEWIIELEQALVKSEIDIAIHSSKDVPIDILEGTKLVPVLKRENPFDVIVLSPSGKQKLKGSLSEVDEPLLLGTASLRRIMQLKLLNSNISCHKLRGNINTRIGKLESEKDLDGVVLAYAGISRLGLKIDPDLIYLLNQSEMTPAVNQGALVAQIRSNDSEVLSSLNKSVDGNEALIWSSERRVIEALQADCGSAVGVFAQIYDGKFSITTRVLGYKEQVNNAEILKIEYTSSGSVENNIEIINEHIETLLSRGAADLV